MRLERDPHRLHLDRLFAVVAELAAWQDGTDAEGYAALVARPDGRTGCALYAADDRPAHIWALDDRGNA